MVHARPNSGNRCDTGESGFTLIELMASLTLLAIGIVGVIGVMNSSFRVVGTAASRSRATSIATKYIELIRAKPYKSIPVATSGTNYTVISPQPGPVPPAYVERVGGQAYDVKYVVTQENEVVPAADGTSKAGAYKKAVVWVGWRDGAGYHDIYQTSLIYPGGLGVFNAANSVNQGGSNSTAPLKPKTLVATPVEFTSSVDLVWTPPDIAPNVPPPASWVVQYSRSATFANGEVQEVATNLLASVHQLRVSDLADQTTYHFRVYAKSADGVLSAQAATATNITTLISSNVACTVGTASVTPSAIKKRTGNDSGKLTSDPVVEVQTNGTCLGTIFEIAYSPRDGATRTVAMQNVAARTWKATINGGENVWAVGEREIVVSSTTAGVKKVRANLRLVVCDNSKASCP
jgi:prepilin-type N-terminal cleavage/methylation domain-containing protein